MFPKQYTEGIYEELFNYGPLLPEASKSIHILPHISDNDLSEALPLLPKDKPSLIIFSIPSPFGTLKEDGTVLTHAVTALIDKKHETIYLQEPYVGLTIPAKDPDHEDDKLCTFPVAIKNQLQSYFPDYAVVEAEKNAQNRRENVCQLIAILHADFVHNDEVSKNPFVTREYLEEKWLPSMKKMNECVDESLIDHYMENALQKEIYLHLLMKNQAMTDDEGRTPEAIKNNRNIEHFVTPISRADHRYYYKSTRNILPIDSASASERTQFCQYMFEYINGYSRGKLTQEGQEFIDKVVDKIYEEFPNLFTELAEKNGRISHSLDPDFKPDNEKVIAIKAYVKELQEQALKPNAEPALSSPRRRF